MAHSNAEATICWTINVSRETDEAVRGYLADHGLDGAALSGFIEDAVRWRVFDETLAATRAAFADLDEAAMGELIDAAVAGVREEHGS